MWRTWWAEEGRGAERRVRAISKRGRGEERTYLSGQVLQEFLSRDGVPLKIATKHLSPMRSWSNKHMWAFATTALIVDQSGTPHRDRADDTLTLEHS